MLNGHKLIIDTHCEVFDLLRPYSDGEFWDLTKHTVESGAIYVVGRKQFIDNTAQLIELVKQNIIKLILSNPHEGSSTLVGLIVRLGIEDLVKQQRIIILSGGDMEEIFPHLTYDSFIVKILNYPSNIQAQQRTSEIYSKINKPYKFLFLNGRIRSHRKYLLERFRLNNLLDQCLWTNLDSNPGPSRNIHLINQQQNLMIEPSAIKMLPANYEVDQYKSRVHTTTDAHYKKYTLFNNEWGEIYIKPEPYIDTYFSLVTETVFEYPYSFRTEKIWKPIMIGHPWIAVANTGFYRDLHNLGFKSFNHLIDESFDQITDNQQRIERISTVVEDLCKQDLDKFLQASEDVCKYNQQHLVEVATQTKQAFIGRFGNFIDSYFSLS